jgi:hypothetical protein
MVELVDRMLELNNQKHSGKLAPSQVDRVDREIAATDAEIDNLIVRNNRRRAKNHRRSAITWALACHLDLWKTWKYHPIPWNLPYSDTCGVGTAMTRVILSIGTASTGSLS